MITDEMMNVPKLGAGYRQKSGKRGKRKNRSPKLLMLLTIAETLSTYCELIPRDKHELIHLIFHNEETEAQRSS